MFLKKQVIFCLFLITFIELSSCGIGVMQSPIHPDHPNKCYWKATNTFLSVGSRYRVPNECAQAVCEKHDDGGLYFRITSCAPYGINDPTCREIEPDVRLPFPRCCLRFECTDREGRKVLI